MVKEDKSSWFRKLGATATIMVPTTRGSSLAKGLREVLRKHGGPVGISTKVVERPGRAVHSNITSNSYSPENSVGGVDAHMPGLEVIALNSVQRRV